MNKKISKECMKTIQTLLSYEPDNRPTIKELLNGKYVKKMCDKFEWNLEKLIKIKKMKQITQPYQMNNLKVSNISSVYTGRSSFDQSSNLFFENSINNQINKNDSSNQNENSNLFKKLKVIDEPSKQIFNFRDDEGDENNEQLIQINYIKSNDDLHLKSNLLNFF